MAQQTRISRNNTVVRSDGSATVVTLHGTDIVSVMPSGSIRLCTGGYFTATTKTRMNQVAYEMGLGYKVFAKDRKWFVEWQGEVLPFTGDSIVLYRKGE